MNNFKKSANPINGSSPFLLGSNTQIIKNELNFKYTCANKI